MACYLFHICHTSQDKNLQSSEKQIKNVNAQKFNNSYSLQLYFFFYLFRFSQSNSEINVNLDDSIDFRCPFYPSGTSSSSYKYYLVYIVSIQSSSEYPSNPFEEKCKIKNLTNIIGL